MPVSDPSPPIDPSRIERPASMSPMPTVPVRGSIARRERAQEAVGATAVDRVDEQVGQLRQPLSCLVRRESPSRKYGHPRPFPAKTGAAAYP